MATKWARARRWLVWLAVLVTLAGAAGLYVRSLQRPPVSVSVHQIQRGEVRDRVSSVSVGRVTARREVTLRAEFAGTVTALTSERGSKVKKGDVLLTFDEDDLRDRLRVAESNVALARAQANQSAVTARLARREAGRSQSLHDAGVITGAQLDDATTQRDLTRSAATASATTVRQALLNVELARNALRKANVTAPFDGTVLDTLVAEGDTTVPGSPIISFADTSNLYVAAEIDEADYGRVAAGMPAEVVVDALPDRRLEGRVSLVAPSVTQDIQRNRSVAIEVELADRSGLIVGMSADVDIIVALHESALSVPPQAVRGHGRERYVFVAADGKARKQNVTVGISTWEVVEVTEGLSEGDQVVLSPPSDLEDGAALRVEHRGASGQAQAGKVSQR